TPGRASLLDPQRHGGAGAPLRRARTGLRAAVARDVRDRALGRAQPPARRRPRSLRDQTALLPTPRRLRLVRIGAEGPASRTRLLARGRPGRTRRVPRLRL